jgi:mannitol-1-phosphate 5-dehydrogenase
MTAAPRCVVVGTGRMAGGFIAPLLADAGWSMMLIGRDPEVVSALSARGELLVSTGDHARDRRVRGVSAASVEDARVHCEIQGADLLATAVGPTALVDVGRWLAPHLRERLAAGRPVNVITFENHRRAPELLTSGLLEAESSLAAEVGVRLGIGGGTVWRAIASRRVELDGVAYDVDHEDECHVDEVALLDGLPPRDGSLPGIGLSTSFDDLMVEKLWLFNAGHAAAAFLGWAAGHETVAQAMADPEVRRSVVEAVDEARLALEVRRYMRHGNGTPPARTTGTIVARYADPALADPVTRVAREPRRKLAPDDRLIDPAVTCLAAGLRPVALASVAAAALAYAEPDDAQACDIQAEIEHFGPEEALAAVTGLYPRDELSELICARYREMRAWALATPGRHRATGAWAHG